MSMSDEITNGEICGDCGIPFVGSNGFPSLCWDCWDYKHEEAILEGCDVVDDEGFQRSITQLVEGKEIRLEEFDDHN